jgi:hypothetical protein
MDERKTEPRPRIEANKLAPAYGTADIFIKAPIEQVWRILSDLENWPSWNKGVSKIRVSGPIAPGTSFVWTANGSKITSRLEEIDPPRRIAWSGRMPGIRATHVWELRAEGVGTRVRTEESFEGIVAGLLRGIMTKTLAKAINQGTASLRAVAESQA